MGSQYRAKELIDQGRRQGCSIGMAFRECGSINARIVCDRVATEACIPRKLSFFTTHKFLWIEIGVALAIAGHPLATPLQ